ncbi:MAG: N-acetylmuramoyl-L-alanine amidase family protein, partial [Rickettsiales bacterium]
REVLLRNQGPGKPYLMLFDLEALGALSPPAQPKAVPPAKPAATAPTPQQRPDWAAVVDETPSLPDDAEQGMPLPEGFAFKYPPVPELKPVYLLRKPTVVIDAGHGGQDPGATGVGGTKEKYVTLRYALSLRRELLRTGRYNVVLTRDDDRYILLRGRLAIGRKAKGDIFISLHADSAGNHATRGLSVYTLSETASDKEAAALAARENKVDLLFDLNLSTEQPDVTEILIDLAQRETMNKSSHLADTLVAALSTTVRLLPNTHRYAGFAVLKAPDVPSVLIELGFLSNRKDEALINSREYREKVSEALVMGIDHYFESQKFWQPE